MENVPDPTVACAIKATSEEIVLNGAATVSLEIKPVFAWGEDIATLQIYVIVHSHTLIGLDIRTVTIHSSHSLYFIMYSSHLGFFL